MFTTKHVKQDKKLSPPFFVLISRSTVEVSTIVFPVSLGFTILNIVQFWAAQCCSHSFASTGHVMLHPPCVQFWRHFSPLHSMVQLPESQSWRHDGESHTPWQPPSEHRCKKKSGVSHYQKLVILTNLNPLRWLVDHRIMPETKRLSAKWTVCRVAKVSEGICEVLWGISSDTRRQILENVMGFVH